MNVQPPGKPRSSLGPSLKKFVIRGPEPTKPDNKASRQEQHRKARTTLDSEGLQSPRRPAIDPQSDERQTRQRLDEEEILRKIDRAMTRNDDGLLEELRPQLKEVRQRGVVLRESLASTRAEREEQLQACGQKLRGELENTSLLRVEFQTALAYVMALEDRIKESAARAEKLTKEFEALFGSARADT